MSLLKKFCMAVFGFLVVISCLTTVAAVLGSFHFWLFLHLPAKPSLEKRQFFIPPKTGAWPVARLLESEGVIRDARTFYLLCWFENSLHRLQAGEYAFSTLYGPQQVLDQLVNGKVVIHTVTLPEGSTLWDVARILDQKDLASQDEIIRIAENAELARSLEINANGLEGYLFPDTYLFKKPVSSTYIATTMVKRFWQRLPAEWRQRGKELGLSLHQIVILASIIEKEAAVDSERPIISGVFYNRLKINMPLQSDPTAVYDIPGFSGPVTAAHLSRGSPYNTYRIKGLPPGPICSPGAKSIRAALYPDKVPFLYFVSNNDGTHHFSVTVEEHRNAVAHYYELKKKAAEATRNSPPELIDR
ncbi:Aminodeoxychorismate lyase [Syntrophobacter sp. SbD1]|nr:Aminodeoxychorismate lyase [Syntrophobacter sp. SbD1]